MICICGKQAKNKYCSNACQQLSARNAKRDLWLDGKIPGGSWYGVFRFARDWLIASFGEKCSQCGWSEVNPTTGVIPVQVDHINGDGTDHRPENLRFLCPSCHSLTPTYGGANRGHGRSERYKLL